MTQAPREEGRAGGEGVGPAGPGGTGATASANAEGGGNGNRGGTSHTAAGGCVDVIRRGAVNAPGVLPRRPAAAGVPGVRGGMLSSKRAKVYLDRGCVAGVMHLRKHVPFLTPRVLATSAPRRARCAARADFTDTTSTRV